MIHKERFIVHCYGRLMENNHLHLWFTLVNDFWDEFTSIE